VLALYDRIWLIPGVEITLNPGVHMLVLSSKKDSEELSLLLDEVGYTNEKRGTDLDYVPNMDIKTFLNSTYLKNKIVIAPHVDSGQGIFNTLDGMYRAEIFKSSNIHAISCNNAKQLENIQRMVKNDPHYKREKPWAYINSSDAHCVEDIGKKVSYVSVDRKSFGVLREVFVNSTESISDVENQQVADLIEHLLKSQKAMLIKESLDDEYEMSKIMCACFNSGYHSVIIGVTKDKELIGSNISVERMREILKSTEDWLTNIKNASATLLAESLGNGRNIYIILVRKTTTKLCYIKTKNEAYVFNKKIVKASVYEIEKIVERKLLLELEKFQEKSDETIIQIQNNVKTLQYPITRYKMAMSIENSVDFLCELVDVEVVKASECMKKWEELELTVGEADGQLYFVENFGVRLNNAVLRYTCPKTKQDIFSDEEKKSMKRINETSIVVAEKGGIYLVTDCREECYIESDEVFLVLSLTEEFWKKYSIYSTVAWLKSSAFIWYMLKKVGTVEMHNPDVFKQIIIPKVSAMQTGSEIEKLVQEIIQVEREFLLIAEEKSEDMSEDELDAIVNEHNDRVAVISKQIDDIFFNAVGFGEKERKIISEDIEAANIYNYLV